MLLADIDLNNRRPSASDQGLVLPDALCTEVGLPLTRHRIRSNLWIMPGLLPLIAHRITNNWSFSRASADR